MAACAFETVRVSMTDQAGRSGRVSANYATDRIWFADDVLGSKGWEAAGISADLIGGRVNVSLTCDPVDVSPVALSYLGSPEPKT